MVADRGGHPLGEHHVVRRRGVVQVVQERGPGHVQRAREQAGDLLAHGRGGRRGVAGDLRRGCGHRVPLHGQGQGRAVGRGDGAALGRDRDDLEPELRGLLAEAGTFQPLQLNQPARHQGERETHAQQAGVQPAGGVGPAQFRPAHVRAARSRPAGPGAGRTGPAGARALRTGLPRGAPAGVAGAAGPGAARARGHRRPARAARPVPAVPVTTCGHGVYPGTVGIPGMWPGWLCSRPVVRLRKCSRGWITMPRAAARCASEEGDSSAAIWAWSACSC